MIYNIIDTYVSCCDIQNILYANKYIILYNIILYIILYRIILMNMNMSGMVMVMIIHRNPVCRMRDGPWALMLLPSQ